MLDEILGNQSIRLTSANSAVANKEPKNDPSEMLNMTRRLHFKINDCNIQNCYKYAGERLTQ